jgi:DNA-directed RNA polymerase sigma subunit (sigma70/sigma32)
MSNLKPIGVQKGSKRGSYKRSKMKRSQEEVSEDGMSYQQIADLMNTTVTEVKRIEASALQKLRKPTEANKAFRDYLITKLSDA